MTSIRCVPRGVWALTFAVSFSGACAPRRAASDVPANAHTPVRPDPRESFDASVELPATEVAGDDADRDQIRDDVAAYIDQRYAAAPWKRLAARQLARAAEHELVAADADDRDRAFDAADESGRAMECLFAYLDDESANAVWKELEARTVDTEPRLLAYAHLQKLLGGGYFPGAPDPKESCAFDMQGLTP